MRNPLNSEFRAKSNKQKKQPIVWVVGCGWLGEQIFLIDFFDIFALAL